MRINSEAISVVQVGNDGDWKNWWQMKSGGGLQIHVGRGINTLVMVWAYDVREKGIS